MSEKQPRLPENTPNFEQPKATREQLNKAAELLRSRAEKEATSSERKEATREAHKKAEKEAISGKEHVSSSEKKQQHQPIHRNHKKQTYKATMQRVEAKLPAYQRIFSQVINNNTVDAISHVAARTVARPSALLGGGVVAFLALIAITYYANSIGFEVSTGSFVVFVFVGWGLGLTIEALIKLLRRSST